MEKASFTRSSSLSTKFANSGKIGRIQDLQKDFSDLVQQYIDLLWGQPDLPKYISLDDQKRADTNLPARFQQVAGKVALAAIKGTLKKKHKTEYIINKLRSEGKEQEANKLQARLDAKNIGKPVVDLLPLPLDSRFIDIEFKPSNDFDGWLVFSPGDHTKIKIPFKRTAHFNEMMATGKMKDFVSLTPDAMTFVFEFDKPDPPTGRTLGIDIGQTSVVSTSDGFVSGPNDHGYDLKTITDRLCRKQKDSKAFRKTQEHRKNYINWCINQINFSGIGKVHIENIRNLRYKQRTSRALVHWAYTLISGKIERKCEELGVPVIRISPTYTSQRCAECGWTCKRNRKGKTFRCGQCDHVADADLNAARNISLDLPPIWYRRRKQRGFDSQKGFWWRMSGPEPIVPVV